MGVLIKIIGEEYVILRTVDTQCQNLQSKGSSLHRNRKFLQAADASLVSGLALALGLTSLHRAFSNHHT